MRAFRNALCLLCSSALLVSCACAATTGTLRSLYGLHTGKEADALVSELSAVQRTIRSTVAVKNYNAIVESYTTDQIDMEINELTHKVDSLCSQITSGIDLPVDELLRLEAEYTAASDSLNVRLNVKASYDLTVLPEMTEDIDELLLLENALSLSLKEALTFADLGDITYYPVINTNYSVTSDFGYRYDPVGVRGYQFHSGIDLIAKEGTPIGAWFNGVVLSTGDSFGSGLYVWLDHGDGVQSFYSHLSSVDVSIGDMVSQGDIIAHSGNTGFYTTGPHLHLGLYIDGVPVDPAVVLG